LTGRKKGRTKSKGRKSCIS